MRRRGGAGRAQENYVARNLNPTFGRLFEAKCVFPRDGKLTLAIYDYDMVSANDLIGVTVIDLEARWLSMCVGARGMTRVGGGKRGTPGRGRGRGRTCMSIADFMAGPVSSAGHAARRRGTAGLARSYTTEGLNKWRDVETPTQLLASLCARLNVPEPVYTTSEDGSVSVTVHGLNNGEPFVPPGLAWQPWTLGRPWAQKMLMMGGLERAAVQSTTTRPPRFGRRTRR